MQMKFKEIGDFISAMLSIIILSMTVSSVIFSFILTNKYKLDIELETSDFLQNYGELYETVKKDSIFQMLFLSFFILRRLILVAAIVLLQNF